MPLLCRNCAVYLDLLATVPYCACQLLSPVRSACFRFICAQGHVAALAHTKSPVTILGSHSRIAKALPLLNDTLRRSAESLRFPPVGQQLQRRHVHVRAFHDAGSRSGAARGSQGAAPRGTAGLLRVGARRQVPAAAGGVMVGLGLGFWLGFSQRQGKDSAGKPNTRLHAEQAWPELDRYLVMKV